MMSSPGGELVAVPTLPPKLWLVQYSCGHRRFIALDVWPDWNPPSWCPECGMSEIYSTFRMR